MMFLTVLTLQEILFLLVCSCCVYQHKQTYRGIINLLKMPMSFLTESLLSASHLYNACSRSLRVICGKFRPINILDLLETQILVQAACLSSGTAIFLATFTITKRNLP